MTTAQVLEKSEPTQTSEDDELLTVDYVAQQCNVSDKTVRRWMKGKHLAFILVGPTKRIRIKRSELKRMLTQGK